MAGLQRSAVSFRRQGSSGMVWDDKFLAGLINQQQQQQQNDAVSEKSPQQNDAVSEKSKNDVGSMQRSRSSRVKNDVVAEKLSKQKDVGSMQRSRSNGRGFRGGRVSPAIEPPSPRVSGCGLCGGFAKSEKNRRRSNGGGKRRV